jgi:glutaredoxin
MGELLHRALPLLLLAAAACGETGAGDRAAAPPQTLPVVDDARKDLVLSWYGDGGPEVAASVAEVPQEARREVRVQDPSIPPEARDPGLVFVADLTRPKPDGSYPVRAVPRAEYEKRQSRLKPQAATQPAAASGQAVAEAGGAPVVMYATKHCPVCKTARRWLLDQGIPYVEKDLEADQAAAAELARKGQAQGVPTSGVPIFEVRGRLIPGFDQGAIRAALHGAPPQQPTAPPPGPAPAPSPSPQRIPLQPIPQPSPTPPPAGTQQAI